MSNNLQQSISIFNGEELIYSNENDYVTVTVTMLKTILKQLTGKSTSIPSFLGYGDLSGGVTAKPTDTKLDNEFSDDSYSRIKLYNYSTLIPELGDESSYQEGQLSLIFVDSSGNSWKNIKEIGIFLGETGSNMVAVYNPSTAIEKVADKSLIVEWTIRFRIPEQTTS